MLVLASHLACFAQTAGAWSNSCTCLNFWSFLGAFAKFQKATVRFVKSFCPPSWNTSAPTGRIFMKCDISVFFETFSRKFKFHYNLTRIILTSHGDLCTFMIISRSVLLRMRNIPDKSCRKNMHAVFSYFLSRNSRGSWCNVVKYGTARQAEEGNIIRRMRFGCWITKATNTRSEYVVLIAFLLQQWLHECAPFLRYTYFAHLVDLMSFTKRLWLDPVLCEIRCARRWGFELWSVGY